jgi:cell division protein YceG involved in septum cleavage
LTHSKVFGKGKTKVPKAFSLKTIMGVTAPNTDEQLTDELVDQLSKKRKSASKKKTTKSKSTKRCKEDWLMASLLEEEHQEEKHF